MGTTSDAATTIADLEIAPDGFRGRVRRLQAQLSERGLPGALVVSRGASTGEWGADVLYLTNHFTHAPLLPDNPPHWAGFGYAAVVVPAEGETTLIADIPDYREDLVVADEVRVGASLWAEIPKVLGEKGLTDRVGLIGEQTFTYNGWQVLSDALPGIQLARADDLIESLRRIKSPAEIARMRQASSVGARMMKAYMEAAQPGATEADCMAAAHAAGIPLGACPWDCPTGSGPWASYYVFHRNPAWDHTRPLEAGDIIHPDMFGTVRDYQYDFSRTAVVGGRATPEQREMMECAVAVIEHLAARLRPGVRVSEVFEAGRAWLMENAPKQESGGDEGGTDFLELFPSFGHGIGLTWERPYVMADEEMLLEEGMVLALETQIAGSDGSAAGFEHNVVVTDGEPEILSAAVQSVWWD